MSDEFSTLPRVKADKGKAQWALPRHVKSETNTGQRLTTHVMEMPYLMPATIIFVHGVNSDGEWYERAATQFCHGLNKRLGRNDLKSGGEQGYDDVALRFRMRDKSGVRFPRPVIPFYWGYKLQPGDEERYPGIHHHKKDRTWGGGPFQNGTNCLLPFWQDGFRRKLLDGIVDLQKLNPEIDRQLQDAPPRGYYVHAAKRLAHLIDTIREDFPNEPVNVVAHSQGNMIAMCAMLYLKKRAPDTLMLNSAPYAFDTKITDWLAATGGWSEVQSEQARLNTFRAVAEKIASAKTAFKDDEADADCSYQGIEGHTVLYVHHSAQCENWQEQIGSGPVNEKGQQWHEDARTSRDNRGKVFVNFNPHDRVIGISAVEGIGWRGIPEKYLSDKTSHLMPNVYQRIVARNSGLVEGVPAVGERQNYWFQYFHEQMVPRNVATGSGGVLVTSDGKKVQTEDISLRTFDKRPAYEFWIPEPKKIMGMASVQGTPGERERVWINAPVVPEPAVIKEGFDLEEIQFDGLQKDKENEEQAKDFEYYKEFNTPQTVNDRDLDGRPITRLETPDEMKKRLENYAKQKIPQTDHAQILRYGSESGDRGAVAQVFSYDLTVGQGYAWGDADYWQYLVDLADWTVSDPYYHTGKLPAPGGYPDGLDASTVLPKDARQN